MTLDELYDTYGEKMYHYMALRLGSLQDAEDVLQETFCRLARYSVRWALVHNPRAFVFKVLRNESNRYLARRIKDETDERTNLDRPAEPVSIIESPDENASQVADALARLPDEQRDIIILKVFHDFTFKEIAGICGLSANTAASRYRYAKEKLRILLEGKI